jgi:hypothetical protein
LLLQRAGAFPNNPVVVHVEPDLWGFLEQRATGDNAATVAVQVSATGMPELAGLPNTAAGLAQGIIRLRDQYAPNVILAYHMSVWGTGNDIVYTNPPDATVDSLATRSANFYLSFGANFDVIFLDWTDRDAAFKQFQYGDGGAAWWDAGDYARNIRFLTRYMNLTQKRLVIWQIPIGNTRMRAMNNTWNHYQDNHVEWILDDPSRTHLNDYLQAGVIAYLFGRGADGATCYCDANRDGVTNPPAINGNNQMSINADDDGGFFRQQSTAYYTTGAMSLPFGGPSGNPTATRTPTPVPPTSTRTPTPPTATSMQPPAAATATWTRTPAPATNTAAPAAATATSVPGGATTFTSSANTAPSTVAATQSIAINAFFTSNNSTTALVDIEVYNPSNVRVFQQYWDNQPFTGGQQRSYSPTWQVPAGTATGSYVVRLGVFSPGWGTLYHWNSSAATFTVGTSGAGATATPLPTATRTPLATATATSAPSPTPGPSSMTVIFDDHAGQNTALTGQYPSGVIDWGARPWYLSAPWGRFTTKSLSFNSSSITSASFTFVTPRRLVSLQAYNGGGTAATVTISCPGQPTTQVTLAANQLATIATSFTGGCSTLTISTSNGWWTNFDNLVLYTS